MAPGAIDFNFCNSINNIFYTPLLIKYEKIFYPAILQTPLLPVLQLENL